MSRGSGWPSRLSLRLLARRRLPASSTPRVALTLDDGPHPVLTPRWLELLALHELRATFFVSGQACEERPDLVARMLAAGHEVANHGHAHLAPEEASTSEYVADVMRTQRVLEGIAGGPVARRFRPPYGRMSLAPQIALRRRGFEIVLWSADARDSFDREAAAVTRNVLDAAAPGAIVLLHEDAPWSAAALPAIVRGLRDRGFEIGPLGCLGDAFTGEPASTPAGPAREPVR